MEDQNLEEYFTIIKKKYGTGIISEAQACEILNFSKIHFCRLRKKKPVIIPFFKIGLRVSYLINDILEFIKNNRIK